MSDRGNVLVLFCDQLRRDIVGWHGGPVRTPNLDAFAQEAVVFDRAYTPTAICSPARASLLTGLYAHEHHMYNNSSPRYSYCQHLRPDLVTLHDWAADAGCQTAYFGKWHVGPAEDLYASSFEVTHRDYGVTEPLLSSSHWHPTRALGEVVEPVGTTGGMLDIPMEEFPDVIAARMTRRFLREHDGQRPFLAFCGFPGPHSPWLPPREFGIRYCPEDIPIWPNRHDSFEGKPLNQRKLRLNQAHRDGLANVSEDDDTLRKLLACCFSYVELIDLMAGEVIEALKEAGLYEDTTIIFTADHGDMAGSHGFASKGSYMYDEIYRIPMIVKPAGRFESRRVDAPVHLMDATATCLHTLSGEAAEEMGGQQLHGRSLLPLATGDDQWPRQWHYAQYHGDWYGHYSARMVTDGRWKLVWNLSDRCELYDLEADPHELTNRFYDDDVTDVRQRCFQVLISEAERLGDAHPRLFVPEVEQELEAMGDGPLQV